MTKLNYNTCMSEPIYLSPYCSPPLKMSLPELARAVREIRDYIGATRERVATRIGALPQEIDLLERHPERVNTRTILAVCSALGIQVVQNNG